MNVLLYSSFGLVIKHSRAWMLHKKKKGTAGTSEKSSLSSPQMKRNDCLMKGGGSFLVAPGIFPFFRGASSGVDIDIICFW